MALAATAGLFGAATAWALASPDELPGSGHTPAIDAACSIEQIEYKQLPVGPGQHLLSVVLAVDGLNGLAKDNLKYAASIVRSERNDTGNIVAEGQVVRGGVKNRIAWENSGYATMYFDPGESADAHYGVSLRVGPQSGDPEVVSSNLNIDCGDADFVFEQQGEARILVDSNATVACAAKLGKLMLVPVESADETHYTRLSDDPRDISTCGD